MSDFCNTAVGCELIGNRPRLNAVEGQVDRADIAVDRDPVAEAVRRANADRRGDIGVIPDLGIYAADGNEKPLDKLVIAYHISKGRRFCPLGAAPHDIADERTLLIDVHQMIAVLDWAQALDLNAPAIDHLDPRIRRQAYCKGQRQGEKYAYRFFHGHSSLSKLFFLLRFILHESGAKVKKKIQKIY